MKLNELKPAAGSRSKRLRKGRGLRGKRLMERPV